jgi:hypothetical protein
VLYCVLLKAAAPELAAAAAAGRHGSSKGPSAAEVVAAASRKVAATLSHQMQALGRLKLGGWGFKRQGAGAEEPAGTRHGSSSSTAGGSHDHLPAHEQQAPGDLGAEPPAAAAGGAGSVSSAAPGSPAVGAAAVASATTLPEPLEGFLLCLDQLVQQAFTLLRDQLKRRLSPLLADCVTPIDTDGVDDGSGSQRQGEAGNQAAAAPAGDEEATEPLSPSAGAAVAGAAAASAAHAEAALLTYRSWSELTGVLHAATVALRAAHVPRALRAAIIEQVRAKWCKCAGLCACHSRRTAAVALLRRVLCLCSLLRLCPAGTGVCQRSALQPAAAAARVLQRQQRALRAEGLEAAGQLDRS